MPKLTVNGKVIHLPYGDSKKKPRPVGRKVPRIEGRTYAP